MLLEIYFDWMIMLFHKKIHYFSWNNILHEKNHMWDLKLLIYFARHGTHNCYSKTEGESSPSNFGVLRSGRFKIKMKSIWRSFTTSLLRVTGSQWMRTSDSIFWDVGELFGKLEALKMSRSIFLLLNPPHQRG